MENEPTQKRRGLAGRMLQTAFGTPPSGKFGAFAGVFTPSILTILGVIMFLRFPWVVGNLGLAGALIMVVVAHMLTIPTALSVASIATNRTTKGGGIYYMLSRSLGPEIGGAIGITLFFAQALSVSLYVLGFTEAFVAVFPGLSPQIVSLVTVLAVAGLAFWDTSLALKSQYIIMLLIALSLMSIFLGHGGHAPSHIALWGETVKGQAPKSFAAVFAVFFPAVTGFTQGVSMSGDLQNPKKSIPNGTLTAVAVGLVIYVLVMVWLAIQADPGELRRLDTVVIMNIARWGFIVTLGIWGATLSSAMGSILGAPRILQALAQDEIMPKFLAKGHGSTNMPRTATIFSLGVALVGLALAYTSTSGLNAIASVITMFFLASYGAISLACGMAKWSQLPSFRPTFKVPAIISLAGAVGSFYVMSLVNLPAMIASVVIMALIYLGLQKKNISKTWGDMRHGIWSALVRKGLYVLRDVEYHPINWQPHLLILGGSPLARPHLLQLGKWIGGLRGIVTYFVLLPGDAVRQGNRKAKLQAGLQRRVRRFYPQVFTKVHACPTVFTGAMAVSQSYGLAGFEPNTIVLGWSRDEAKATEFVDLLRSLTTLDKCLLLVSYKDTDPLPQTIQSIKSKQPKRHRWSKRSSKGENDHSGDETVGDSLQGKTTEKLVEVRGFGRCRTIDIWWRGLENNGGLMLLIANLLTENQPWQNARIRVKMIVQEGAPLSKTRKNLEQIIAEARIEAEAEILVHQPPEKPVTDIIVERSNADLVLMGLRPPDQDQDPVEFVRRIEALVSRLPTTILVRSSTDFHGAQMLFEQDWGKKTDTAPAGKANSKPPKANSKPPKADSKPPKADSKPPKADSKPPRNNDEPDQA